MKYLRCAGVLGAVVLSAACSSLLPRPSSSPAATPLRHVRVSTVQSCWTVLKLLDDEAARRDPSLRFDYLAATHSTGAVEVVSSGLADMAMISRELDPNERKPAIAYRLVADDGLVVAVCRGTGVKAVTSQQLRDIYSGRIRNWARLGAKPETITVLDRGETDAAKGVFRRFVLGAKLKVTPLAITLRSQGDVLQAIQGTPGAIGYFSLGDSASLGDKVDRLSLDGVAPTLENVASGRYKMIRQVGLVYRTDAASELSGLLGLIGTQRVAGMLAAKGYTPAEVR
jgi:phosphate transport system substrate-binding protein